jgi:lysyl-tRNA synthetase class 2
VLIKRAQILQEIRAFFLQRSVLEVETPSLSQAATTDPSIHSIEAGFADGLRYLHTSPEFPMKRLLSAGSGDIFQICKVFRASESGRYHNPEFSLLEWYRLGFNHKRLADEVVELIRHLAPAELLSSPVKKISYQALFKEGLGIDPLDISSQNLEVLARQRGVHPGCSLPHDAWLDLLLSHCLIPALPMDSLTVVHAYPASQAALARIDAAGQTAARFEVFWGPLELANGYFELTDAAEQRQRFEMELRTRQEQGLAQIPIDENLIFALQEGLPDCAGVALGLDRLLMRLLSANHINDVLAFPFERA